MEEIKTLNFFGESGLTSTSANHVANLAKEAVRNAHEKLAATRFYTETVGLLASGTEATVRKGWGSRLLNELPDVVRIIADANSLIAWLREAIKEKNRRMKEAEVWTDKETMDAFEAHYKEFYSTRPVRALYPTEESIKQSWSIGEQEKYLSLEAEAAALGKFIHEDGYLSKARIDLMQKVENPTKIDLNGHDTIVHNYIPTVKVEEVNRLFIDLQDKYRKVQAELNGMKKHIDDIIFAEKMRIDGEYADALREWQNIDNEYERQLNLLKEEEQKHRNERIKAVQSLKIVIPNRLRPLYEQLTNKSYSETTLGDIEALAELKHKLEQ